MQKQERWQGREKEEGGKLISSHFLPGPLIAVQRQDDVLYPCTWGHGSWQRSRQCCLSCACIYLLIFPSRLSICSKDLMKRVKKFSENIFKDSIEPLKLSYSPLRKNKHICLYPVFLTLVVGFARSFCYPSHFAHQSVSYEVML